MYIHIRVWRSRAWGLRTWGFRGLRVGSKVESLGSRAQRLGSPRASVLGRGSASARTHIQTPA